MSAEALQLEVNELLFTIVITFCRPTKPVQLFSGPKIMALLFVELFGLHSPATLVDNTLLGLLFPLLYSAVNDLPILAPAVFLEAPFLELALILSFAAGIVRSYVISSAHGAEL